MPAAAVIPAPIAYIKVVAVKKLVVEFLGAVGGPPNGAHCRTASTSFWLFQSALYRVGCGSRTFTVKKLECSKQAYA